MKVFTFIEKLSTEQSWQLSLIYKDIKQKKKKENYSQSIQIYQFLKL